MYHSVTISFSIKCCAFKQVLQLNVLCPYFHWGHTFRRQQPVHLNRYWNVVFTAKSTYLQYMNSWIIIDVAGNSGFQISRYCTLWKQLTIPLHRGLKLSESGRYLMPDYYPPAFSTTDWFWLLNSLDPPVTIFYCQKEKQKQIIC